MSPAPLTLAIVAGLLLILFLFERIFPLRQARASLLLRVAINFGISMTAFAAAALLVRPAANWTLASAGETGFGLVHLIPLPAPVQFIVAFLLMDLSFYYWHVLNHRVPFLWRFHNVHHIDPDLDVTTGFRFHVGEVAFSALFRVVQVSVIGMSVWTYAIYEIVFQANTLFHHSNLRLPIGVERFLNKALVTPRMHGIHHSQVRPETNSNYGVVFPWWDRLHRTLGLNIPQSALTIGIAGYSLPDDNRVLNCLLMPFRKQRDYWRSPDGTVPERDPDSEQPERTRLSE